jgi:H+/Cl- antiporter ClcA
MSDPVLYRSRRRRLRRMPFVSPRQWYRRLIFWTGAVVVAAIAIAFADLVAVLVCRVSGGLAGGLFSAAPVHAAGGLSGRPGRLLSRYPVAFAGMCGLGIAAIGVVSGGQTYGTGYEQARGMVEATQHLPGTYVVLKFLATAISYISGIPGRLFAPSLSVGAGLGAWLAHFMPSVPASAIVLLGMVGYFSGVVQAPITATIIVMEMTDNQRVTIPLMATAFLAFGMSRLVCRRLQYSALARRFLEAQERNEAR